MIERRRMSMLENPFYTEEAQGPYEFYQLGDFTLEDGGVIPNCKLAYRTYGKMNENKNNIILIPTWFSGTSQGYEPYIGKNRALNPNKYFIIVINQIGNGLSSSPHNSPSPISMSSFPNVRIADDVRAQHKFITEHFGVKEIALVVGCSMGAQQTYEWTVRYPDMVKRDVRNAGAAKHRPHGCECTETLLEAITADTG